MKKWLQDFWRNPIKRRWVIIINVIGFALSFFTFHLLDKQINPWVSLRLIILALFCEILVFAFYVPDQLKEMWQDIKALIAWSNRDAMYHHYRLKHENKSYKGPDWEDEEFKEIPDLKERVDAFVKASIAYQQIDFERWKKRNLGVNLDHQSQTAQRILIITMATFISLGILFILYKWLKFDSDTISSLIKESRSPVVAALITTVITSPVIFIIWLFRDKNNRMQIENARKDTNLKDFQKLSEWASGFHLPEIKQTTSTKTTNKTAKDVQEATEETATSQEDFLAPEGSNSISRRQGAEALQASAIAQLEAFMFGKYGEQFMQPAFLLIHAIWESIITQQQTRFPNNQEFKTSLEKLYKNPIVSALNKALAGAQGKHLYLFRDSLSNLNLSCLNSHQGLFQRLIFGNTSFIGSNFSYSVLTGSRFINCNLTNSKFMYSKLNHLKLQESKLTFSDLSHATLVSANLSCTKLDHINFSFTDLSKADLSSACLNYAKLHQANLENTVFENTQINRVTIFDNNYLRLNDNLIREDVLSWGAIWDDDPEWLVGKIQDKFLLEKIFKDCEKRQKVKTKPQ